MRSILTVLAGLVLVACSSAPPSGSAQNTDTDAGTPDTGAPRKDSGAPADDSGSASGPKCATPSDCADPNSMVCDPSSATCTAGQCGPLANGAACDASHICVYQASNVGVGACYDRCTPFSGAPCSNGRECVIGKFDGTEGYCKPAGATPSGSACTPSSVTTNCAPGNVCVLDPQQRFCREQCDFWGGAHDCSSLACTPPGVCTGEVPDTAAIDQPCGNASAPGALCGQQGKKLLGWCVGAQQGKTTCRKWCRTKGSDCPQSQKCQPTTVPSIGYCE